MPLSFPCFFFFYFLFLFFFSLSLFEILISSAFNSTKGETIAGVAGVSRVSRGLGSPTSGHPHPDPQLGPAGISCGDAAGPLTLQNRLQSGWDSAGRLQLPYAHPDFLPKRHFGRPQGTGRVQTSVSSGRDTVLRSCPLARAQGRACHCSWAPSREVGAAGGEGLPYRTPPKGFAGTILTLGDPHPPPPFPAPVCALGPSAPR